MSLLGLSTSTVDIVVNKAMASWPTVSKPNPHLLGPICHDGERDTLRPSFLRSNSYPLTETEEHKHGTCYHQLFFVWFRSPKEE